jgi:hypothetical protein
MDETFVQALGVALGFVFTLMIYSYLLGDNPLYRLAVHILIGIGLGYAAVVVAYTVIIPQLIDPAIKALQTRPVSFAEGAQPLLTLLALLLLLKLSRKTAPLGNVTMGFVFGVGSAVAVGGAVLGTLLPQITATAISFMPAAAPAFVAEEGSWLNLLAGLLIMVGTITTLLYFTFDARPVSEGVVERAAWIRASGQIGQVFLMVAFGSLFAGTIVATLALLTERALFMIQAPGELLRLLGIG